MRILIIAGFLGSGKTTLLLSLARALHRRAGWRVAVIENDAGTVGVDAEYLALEGLQVRFLHAGCICCQLRLDLLTTLYEIERTLAPDLVLLEPSGVAGPRQVAEALTGYGGDLAARHLLLVVDAQRYPAIRDWANPFIVSGIEAADTLALNKADAVAAPVLADLAARLRAMNPRATLLPLSALRGDGLPELAEHLLRALDSPEAAPAAPSPTAARSRAPAPALPDAVAHAASSAIACGGRLEPAAVRERAAAELTRLGHALQAAGCRLVGHIKLILKGRGSGYLLLSLTDPASPPAARGALARAPAALDAILNVVVCGLPRAAVEQASAAFLERLRGQLGAPE